MIDRELLAAKIAEAKRLLAELLQLSRDGADELYAQRDQDAGGRYIAAAGLLMQCGIQVETASKFMLGKQFVPAAVPGMLIDEGKRLDPPPDDGVAAAVAEAIRKQSRRPAAPGRRFHR